MIHLITLDRLDDFNTKNSINFLLTRNKHKLVPGVNKLEALTPPDFLMSYWENSKKSKDDWDLIENTLRILRTSYEISKALNKLEQFVLSGYTINLIIEEDSPEFHLLSFIAQLLKDRGLEFYLDSEIEDEE